MFRKIINNFLLFIATILIYAASMPLLFSRFNIDFWFEIIGNLFREFLTLEIFKNKFFLGILIFLVGMPAVIINYFSKKLTRKLNFIILPIFAIALVLIFSFIHVLFFKDSGDMKGLALAIYMGMAIIFQIIFSITVSIFRVFLKKVKTVDKL